MRRIKSNSRWLFGIIVAYVLAAVIPLFVSWTMYQCVVARVCSLSLTNIFYVNNFLYKEYIITRGGSYFVELGCTYIGASIVAGVLAGVGKGMKFRVLLFLVVGGAIQVANVARIDVAIWLNSQGYPWWVVHGVPSYASWIFIVAITVVLFKNYVCSQDGVAAQQLVTL